MSSASVIVGIDLGTTNCAVAWADPALGSDAAVRDFPIVQVQRPGEVAPRPTLPSAIYLTGEHELSADDLALPWSRGATTENLVGEGARWQGARVPGRLVTSAKSWLCHPGVDRTAAILPWGTSTDVSRLSPVEASARLLAHIAAAWDHAHPTRPLAEQEVVVTVPASFDEVARALTVEAAKRAGFKAFTLLEEPQAAFYDFTARRQADLATALAGVRLVLVVDVGGGTTDLTLIQVTMTESGPALRRIAVSDHLMLGGDNMDAALARAAEERLVAGGRRLSTPQWSQLVQAARSAKEALLGAAAPERQRVAIAGEGSRLLGATLATEFARDEVERLVLDGFFPACGADEEPKRASRTGLQELGLPYAQDAAITRHIAAFLRRHATAGHAALEAGAAEASTAAALPRPDAILLNGGVFNSPRLADRLVEVVSAWWPERPRIALLPHESLDLAVARGAARYGLVRRGLGRRISGGVAHALYVGLAPEKGRTDARAVCLIPRGHEEGEQVDLSSRPFLLTLGQPVQFPLYSTTADRVDRPGDVVPVDDSFHPLPPIHTLFKGASAQARAIPVHLRAGLTELGSLEIWCVANEVDERWRLEFDLRAAASRAATTVTESMPERFGEARELVLRVFGSRAQPVEPKVVKDLVRTIEQAIGPRESWSLPLLRELWSLLLAGRARRRRSEHHERAFFQLLGFCLRPGFGYPLDDWRCAETYPLFAERVHHHREVRIWREFWVTWRRIAAGLDAVQQAEIWDYLKPNLARRLPASASKNLPALKGVQPDGLDEMVRTAASLELLPPAEKELLGRWLVGRIQAPDAAGGPWAWALGRVGARIPLGGSVHQSVDADTVAGWVDALLTRGLSMQDGSAFAAVQLSRLSGDRTRDLDEAVRARVVAELTRIEAPERWRRLIQEVAVMEAADEARSLGDTLPIGLRLG